MQNQMEQKVHAHKVAVVGWSIHDDILSFDAECIQG